MGDRLQAGKPSRYVTSYPGQLSLAIPPWVGAMIYMQRKLGCKQAHRAMHWSRSVNWCLAEGISTAPWVLWALPEPQQLRLEVDARAMMSCE